MSRLAIFLTALVPRLVVGYITFGSVDAIHCLRNFVRILDGEPIDAPYLPGIELVLWVSGVVTYHSSLPVLFAWKVAPLVADALIAPLLFDATKSRRAGLVYALCPIPIVVACVHPTWESMFLYALLLALVLADRAPALAGVATVLSIIVKPVAVPLAIFLIPRDLRRALAFVGGGAAAAAAYAIILAVAGALPDLFGVIQYAGGGVQVFGLAVRPHNRLVAVVAAVVIAAFVYFRRKCTRAEAVLLFFAITLGLSGMSVQYLAWIVPFAVLCRRWWFTAAYTIAAGVFVLFYYQLPQINLTHIEDLGAFGLLRPFGAFGPPPPGAWMRTVLQIDGNLVIPLLLLGFAAFEVARLLSRTTAIENEEPRRVAPFAIPAAAALLLFCIAMSWAYAQPRIEPFTWIASIEQRISAYDVVRYRGPGIREGTKVWLARTLLEPDAANRLFNVTTVGCAWIAVAALTAALSSRANARREGA